MRTQKSWLDHAEALNAARSEVHLRFDAAYPKIRAGVSRQTIDDPALVAWRTSTENLRAEFDRMYPPWFWDSLKRIREKIADEPDIDVAVTFLEADPVAHRSGYIKVDLCRWLARSELKPSAQVRLANVVLRQLEIGWRQGFVQYCKLARSIDSGKLRADIERYSSSSDDGVSRRAKRMLAVVVTGEWKRENRPDRRWQR